MVISEKIKTQHNKVTDLTGMVKQAVQNSGVQDGLCVISVPHTTAALVITSFWDPLGWEDLMDELNRLIPSRIDFKHQESPTDASGHLKSALTGTSMVQIIEGGRLLLGSSQGIYFLEFDGPRTREVIIKIMQG